MNCMDRDEKRGMDRRGFIKTLGATAMGACLFPWQIRERSEAGKNPPNIVYIVSDDMGYGELSCYGGQFPTPNIDSIATNGIRFTQGYVTAPVCSPTRAGIMTGRYQQRFGYESNPGFEARNPVFGVPSSETTFADRMKALGYKTGCFGKWHLGNMPQYHPFERGFDEFYGFLGGAHSYFKLGKDDLNRIRSGREFVEKMDYTTDAFTRQAVSFIERNHNNPFFLYLPYNAIHSPFEAPEKYLSRFPNIKEPRLKRLAAMLSAMDDGVGDILETLRKYGIEENTLVIFHSDNGAPNRKFFKDNGPLRGYKGQVFEGGIRIPFMIQWKDHLKAGVVSDDLISSLDVLPTAVEAAGGKVLPEWQLDGKNLMPYLIDQDSSAPHDTLYWRMEGHWAIRKGDWKLVRQEEGKKPSLFNIAEDIGEENDLAAEMPDMVRQLQIAYDSWDAEMAEPLWESKEKQRLRQR